MRRLAKLRESHPDLVVEVLTSNERLDLLAGKADLALRFATTSEPTLMQRRVAQLGWALYASADHLAEHGRPERATDLGEHRVVGFDTPMAGVPGALWLAAHAPNARMVMRADSLVALVNATVMGMGLGVLPCFLAANEPNLVRLGDEVLGSRTAWLVAHPDVARIPRVRTVMDFVIAMMAEEGTFLAGGPTGLPAS